MANNESDKLNTGIGGFVVDGRLHQMTPGDPNLVEPSSPVSPSEKKGRLAEVDLSGDIPKTTKTTLADYLGKSTTRKNYYPLDGETFNQGISAEKQFGEQVKAYTSFSLDNPLLFPQPPPSSREVSITSPGNMHVPSLEPTINTNHFANSEELSTSETSPGLQGWYPHVESDSSIFDTPNLPFVKGRSEGWDETGATTGNNLLRDTMDPSVPSFAATEKVLRVLSKNRFSPQGSLSPSIEYGIGIPTMHLQDASISVGANFRGGAWARGEGGIIEGSFYAESLSGSIIGYNSPLYNPRYPNLRTNDMVLASDVLLNGAKFNGKDEKKEYESFSEVFAALAYNDELEREINYISINDGKAHKNSYTSKNMFDGVSETVTFAMTQFSIRTFSGRILKAFDGDASSLGEGYFQFNDVLTVESFQYLIGVGLDVFFNQSNDLMSAYATKNQLLSSWPLPKSSVSYGHAGILIETSKSIINAINEYDISLKNANVVSGREAIKIFGKSRLAKILVAFSKIGESQIQKESRLLSRSTQAQDNFLDGVKTVTTIGEMSKWSSNTAKSIFLQEKNLSSIPGPLFARERGANRLTDHNSEAENRISKETIDFLEKELDSDYMPFYFHDLRTNEIITFHAFLSSLSDGFSASYDSIEGFGRVEPIKIYKGTQRKISMEFSIVSTNPDDFDIMWYKINKLVTLVYPQYTEGRRLEKNGYNFVQPFSQMMGASPLIRIRLGNVLRSNYSRFSLAKLFGAGLENISFKKNKDEVVAAEKKAVEVRQERSRERLLIEKKEEISKKILEDSRKFDPNTGIKFLLKNPNAVNSLKGQIPNFKTLFMGYQRLAKNLCCVIKAVEILPQRTATRVVTERRTVLDEEATIERNERVEQQQQQQQYFQQQIEIEKSNLEKAKEVYVENLTKPYKNAPNRWGNSESRNKEERQRRAQEQKDFNDIAEYQKRLNYMQEQESSLQSSIESNSIIDEPLTKELDVNTTKTYRWVPLLVTLEISLNSNNLDDTNDPQLKEELTRFKESVMAFNLGENITIKTLSGNLKLSNTQIKLIENSFTTQAAPTPTTAEPPAESVTPEQQETKEIDPLLEFMDPKNNALVKSFEEAGGKGLAGVIESLDFSWLDQAMWDMGGGIDGGDQEPKSRKAPMMCKVSVSFAPIHDISPGLDSKGRNRAPVYPVGLADIPSSDWWT